MKKSFYLLMFFMALITLNSCKKEAIHPSFDDLFQKPYNTGIIKFQYPITSTKDTTINFTSSGNNVADYGYSNASLPWVIMERLNPKDFQNRAIIFFVATDLNSLTFPYTFKKDNIQNAQINYVIGLRPFYDTNGNLVYGTNTYAASTYDDFELTILSKVNNRLQGKYSGVIKNQDGLTIKIKEGLFDIQIVDR